MYFAVEKGLRFRSLLTENVRLQMELMDRFSFDEIIGGSAAMRDVFVTLGRVAASNVSVLVMTLFMTDVRSAAVSTNCRSAAVIPAKAVVPLPIFVRTVFNAAWSTSLLILPHTDGFRVNFYQL